MLVKQKKMRPTWIRNDMTQNKQTSFVLIDSDAALSALARSIEKTTTVAVDLEADSMFHFKEQVCLIQLCAGNRIYLVDPFQVSSMAPLKPVFKDPGVEKIFHGADYDVRSLFRDFGIEIENLLDTELACRFLGYPETGLEAVLNAGFKIQLDKKFQKKDWSKRPLPAPMLEYAAQDVAYLIPLAEKLNAELSQRGRLAWVREECDLLSRVRAAPLNNMPLFLRVRGAGRLDPRSLGVLEAMLAYRLKVAEQKDRPVFKILSNHSLLQLARAKPLDMDQMASLKVLSRKQLDIHGVSLLHVIQAQMKTPADKLPAYPRQKSPRLKPMVPERIRKLKAWRDEQAAGLELDPAILFNKSMMTAIASAKPASLRALARIPGIRNWQVTAFGESVLRVLSG